MSKNCHNCTIYFVEKISSGSESFSNPNPAQKVPDLTGPVRRERIPVGLCPGSVEVLAQGIAPEANNLYGLVGHQQAVAKFVVLDLGEKVDSGPPGYIGYIDNQLEDDQLVDDGRRSSGR